MQVTVLGCHAGVPRDGWASSGYVVETTAGRVLLDCGPGIATALHTIGGATALDAIIISHLHVDHCFDLLPLGRVLSAPDVAEGREPIPLYVPRGARTILDQLAGLFPVGGVPRPDRIFEAGLEVREYVPGQTYDVAGCRLTLHELRHAATNCGIRLEAPYASLAYTGDTGATEAVTKLAAGVDLLLAEATLAEPERGNHGHLSGGEAGRYAADADVGQLVLTHFPTADPAWIEARRRDAAGYYVGPIQVAAPGRQFTVDIG